MNNENKQSDVGEKNEGNQPTKENNTEKSSESSSEESNQIKQIMEKTKNYARQHWNTGAMILGVGLLARMLMNRRKT